MSRYSTCWQVKCVFTLHKGKPFLLSTHIKQLFDVPAYLVQAGIPFGHGVTHSRFYATEQEAADFAAHLHATHAGRIPPQQKGGQQQLF